MLGRNNQTFELVLPDSVHVHIDFAGGEKVKNCVFFEDNAYPITNVRDFVNRSPAEGWQVTFDGDHHTTATMICNTVEVFVYYLMNSD